MTKPNIYYGDLKESYLFTTIVDKTKAYSEAHPGVPLYRMGVGDVTQPLCPAVIEALHRAVEEQAHIETFQGYMFEHGMSFMREAVAEWYAGRGIVLSPDEVFVSNGAGDDLGAIPDLFDNGNTVMVTEPAYPAYVDLNVILGRSIIHYPSGMEDGFLPMPDGAPRADIIYLCSPGNPTGAAYKRQQLQEWVDYANRIGAVIIFDAAYEAYIEDEDVPHSIYECRGAKECAIEICSLSKTAGFTGLRMGYTIVPQELERGGMNFNYMWGRDRTIKTNGVAYIVQRAGLAVFSEEGRRQVTQQVSVYKQNAKTLMRAFDRLGIWYIGGKNSPYIWLRCPNGMGSWEFFDYLLNEIQVIGTPGEGFGKCGEGFFRFSSFGSPGDTAEAADRIVRLLER